MRTLELIKKVQWVIIGISCFLGQEVLAQDSSLHHYRCVFPSMSSNNMSVQIENIIAVGETVEIVNSFARITGQQREKDLSQYKIPVEAQHVKEVSYAMPPQVLSMHHSNTKIRFADPEVDKLRQNNSVHKILRTSKEALVDKRKVRKSSPEYKQFRIETTAGLSPDTVFHVTQIKAITKDNKTLPPKAKHDISFSELKKHSEAHGLRVDNIQYYIEGEAKVQGAQLYLRNVGVKVDTVGKGPQTARFPDVICLETAS